MLASDNHATRSSNHGLLETNSTFSWRNILKANQKMLSKLSTNFDTLPGGLSKKPCVLGQVPVRAVRQGVKGDRLRPASKGPCLSTWHILKAAENGSDVSVPPKGCWESFTAADIMTSDVISINAEASIFKAMQLLVNTKCSGLPVVDSEMMVLGVVSAYDILALESTPGSLSSPDGYFPPVGRCHNEFDGDRTAMWKEFLGLRKSIDKAKATQVGDGMHETYTVPMTAQISQIAGLIVQKHLHRVFVVDGDSKLVGVISSGDVLRATVNTFKSYEETTVA